MALMMDAQKDLRVDMGENFPYLGLYDRTKASTVLPGGDALLLYHSDGTIWGCPDQPERYDEGLLTARNATLQRIITMWFVSPLVAGIITYAALVAVG